MIGESQGAAVGGSVAPGTSGLVLEGELGAGELEVRPLQVGNSQSHVVNMEISTHQYHESPEFAHLYNSERFVSLSLLGLNITVDTSRVGPGLCEGDEGTQTGDVKQSEVEPRPASTRGHTEAG